jgi:hypothetical protein
MCIRNRTAALAVLALALTAAAARADRVPSQRVPTYPALGTRPDVAVYYTTNGISTLGVYQGVAPRIYASPIVDDPTNPQAKPVFNLVFWGAVQSFGDRSNGATPRPPGPPFPPFSR